MIPLKTLIPRRRTNPSKNPTGNNWSEHKDELKIDFNHHCAYCDSYDGFRHTYFEVDHFIPKSFFLKVGGITLTQYDNLVYSCKFCNNNKSNHWPSERLDVYNDGNKGFIDPCTDEYNIHLYRTVEGGIMWKTDLGKWMWKEAFKFDERQHSIKILWNLNKLRKLIDAMIIELKKGDEHSEEYKRIKEKIGEYTLDYYLIHNELMIFYNS